MSTQVDKELALAAVKQDGLALQFASEPLRRDKEVVLAAVKQNCHALCFASLAFCCDKEVVLATVKQDGEALADASDALCDDKEVVLAAVAQNGFALNFASEPLRNDLEVRLVHARHGSVESALTIVEQLHELTKISHLEREIGRAVELLKYLDDAALKDAVERLNKEFYAPELGIGYWSNKRDFKKTFGVDS